jgi:hypothetical protein
MNQNEKENHMNVRNLYLLNSAVALIFALGMLLVTSSMLALFGLDNTPDTRLLAQFVGVELVVSGLTTLLLRDVTDPRVLSAINFTHMSANALGFVIAINGTFTGLLSGMGWVVALIYAVLGLGFAYFQFFKPSD